MRIVRGVVAWLLLVTTMVGFTPNPVLAAPLASDDFNAPTLDPRWTWVPAPDPVTGLQAGSYDLVGAGTGDAHLAINLAGSSTHDKFNTADAPRVMQAVDNADFVALVKYNTEPAGGWNTQGIVVEQDANRWLRFDVRRPNPPTSSLLAFIGDTTSGNTTPEADVAIPDGSGMFLRVTRTGNLFTFEHSANGTSWTTVDTHTSALTVNSVGLFAANPVGDGFTSEIDYFLNTATASDGDTVYGGPGQLQATPDPVSFAVEPFLSTSDSRAVTVTNIGGASLTVNTATVSGPHAADFDPTFSGSVPLGPGEFTTVGVEFTPQAAGARTATLNINHSGGTLPVSLTGTGGNRAPHVETGEVTFSKQVIADLTSGDFRESHSVRAADFDGDGDLDIVATRYGRPGTVPGVEGEGGAVFWFENIGGSFTTRLLDNDLRGAYPLYIEDVDRDGDTDILATGYFDDNVVWYANESGGLFTKRSVNASTDGPHSVVTGDIDGDSDIDFLTTHQNTNRVGWYENLGDNRFGDTNVIDGAAIWAKYAVFGDFDGDGAQEVAAANYGEPANAPPPRDPIGEIAWYDDLLNPPVSKTVIDDDAQGAYSVFAADIDGVNGTDILAASSLDDTVTLHVNNGSGSFTPQVIDSLADGARTVRADDIDGDGFLDILAAGREGDTVAWYRNDGAGAYDKTVIDAAADGAYGVFAADIDKDGDLDVLSSTADSDEVFLYTQTRAHEATVNQGGTLLIDNAVLLTTDPDDGPAGITYKLTSPPIHGNVRLNGTPLLLNGTFTQADVDAGKVDYLHGGSAQPSDSFDFEVADGGENGVLPAKGSFTVTVSGPPAGGVDVLLQHSGSGLVALWELNSSGGFVGATVVSNPGSSAWQVVGNGDFVSGGGLDVLLQHSGSGVVALWELNSTGGFVGATVVSNPGTNAWQVVGNGDFVAGGGVDVLLQHSGSGLVALWELNTTGGFLNATVVSNPGTNAWQVVGTGDFVAGGGVDVLLQNSGSGVVALWELNTTGGFVGATVVSNPGSNAWQVVATGDFIT